MVFAGNPACVFLLSRLCPFCCYCRRQNDPRHRGRHSSVAVAVVHASGSSPHELRRAVDAAAFKLRPWCATSLRDTSSRHHLLAICRPSRCSLPAPPALLHTLVRIRRSTVKKRAPGRDVGPGRLATILLPHLSRLRSMVTLLLSHLASSLNVLCHAARLPLTSRVVRSGMGTDVDVQTRSLSGCPH